MTQPNPNDTKFEQQQSDSVVAALKNKVEDNLGSDSDKSNEKASEGIADNLEDAQSK